MLFINCGLRFLVCLAFIAFYAFFVYRLPTAGAGRPRGKTRKTRKTRRTGTPVTPVAPVAPVAPVTLVLVPPCSRVSFLIPVNKRAHHNFQLLQQPRLVEDDDLFDEFIFALRGVVLLFEVGAEDACNGIPKLGRELASELLQNLI